MNWSDVVIIAELSGNHNGDIERAIKLIDAAKSAGADAVKLQTYSADTITIDHNGPGFVIEAGPWKGRTLYELYEEAHTPFAWHARLFEHAKKIGIECFSAPFDETAVDLLESLECPVYKIASFEIVDMELIERAAATGKPLIISTGMANEQEIRDALDLARKSGASDVALLHCISAYPAPIEEANVKRIPVLAAKFGCTIGLSDHTFGSEAAVTAVALGAKLIEKHITLARADGGPDAGFSLEPNEFADLVGHVKNAAQALGSGEATRPPSEEAQKPFRRSLYVVRDMEAGEVFSKENVRSIRPGYGLEPKHLTVVLGKRAKQRIARGTPLTLAMVN